MSKEFHEKLAGCCRFFRKSGIIRKPFRVRIVPKEKLPANTLGDYGSGLIRICSGLPGYVARDTLLHELAHHMVAGGHNVAWAEAYSRIYKLYHEGKKE